MLAVTQRPILALHYRASWTCSRRRDVTQGFAKFPQVPAHSLIERRYVAAVDNQVHAFAGPERIQLKPAGEMDACADIACAGFVKDGGCGFDESRVSELLRDADVA